MAVGSSRRRRERRYPESIPVGSRMYEKTATRSPAGERSTVRATPKPGRNDVPDGSINDVLDWVGVDKGRAQRAKKEEAGREGGPRKTLMSALDALIARS